MEKTFKREIAILLLLWLVYVVEVKDAEIIQILVWPIFSFAAAAFGFDAYGKLQRNSPKSFDGRGTERSSQHPDR